MSFTPLENPIGFGAIDFVILTVAALLLTMSLFWRPWIAGVAGRLARSTVWSMALLFSMPIALRLILLPSHPVPHPDLYDEFGHLLIADTLRHWRLANPPHPMHRFFETFFVIQQPSYSSIYPLGNGLMLALGWAVFGTPWAGVLICTGALCALCYWMLRGWTTPEWALLGGLLAVFEFGPLNQWTNNYWGGAFSAAAGCLVFGALPRRNRLLLGIGLALHLLSRPYESVFLFIAVAIWLAVNERKLPLAVLPPVIAALALTALQNYRVTGHWTELPYQLSQYQYGVPAALTFQSAPVPHVPLTPQQTTDYRVQRNFHPGKDNLADYFARLFFRTRYYRFYFFAPLYVASIAFLVKIPGFPDAWVACTCLLFALGINFFPAFQFHYLAAAVCLFVYMCVRGLQQLRPEIARLIVCFCAAQFVIWYALYLPGSRTFAAEARKFDVWDAVDHPGAERRTEVDRRLAAIPGQLLVFVRYWPQHLFRDEWVYNGADIDNQRIVWARDLGDEEDAKLTAFYPGRTPLLLEPDARPPKLSPWAPAPPPAPVVTEAPKEKKTNPEHPPIMLEPVVP